MELPSSECRDHNTLEGRTLGDVLYADKNSTRVSEQHWIELVRSVAAGDQLALRSLFEQTHRIVFTLAVRITADTATAEEVTLDVFHDVWRKASAYDPNAGSVVGWIMNQARSRAIDRIRLEQRKKRVGDGRENVPLQSGDTDPQEAFKLQEQSRLLRQALNDLTLEERQAIETAFFSELTYNETAARLNQPIGTVKTRIRSGLSKLRQALGPELKGL